MTHLLTAEEVLTLAEAAHKPHAPASISVPPGDQPAMVITAAEIADFRHTVRYAAPESLVSCQGCQAQFDFFKATGFTLSDGTRLYTDDRHPGISDEEWSMWVD